MDPTFCRWQRIDLKTDNASTLYAFRSTIRVVGKLWTDGLPDLIPGFGTRQMTIMERKGDQDDLPLLAQSARIMLTHNDLWCFSLYRT
jgi:hypothetical protein